MEKTEKTLLIKRFLENSEDTGRFIVKSLRTGKTYFVEAIDGDEKSVWGDLDPVTKKLQTSNYGNKHKGSIKPSESMIDEENGFTKIHNLGVGVYVEFSTCGAFFEKYFLYFQIISTHIVKITKNINEIYRQKKRYGK